MTPSPHSEPREIDRIADGIASGRLIGSTTHASLLAKERRRLVEQYESQRRELAELRDWGKQVHAALDGQDLGYFDEAPARIAALVEQYGALREAAQLIAENGEHGTHDASMAEHGCDYCKALAIISNPAKRPT